MKVVLATPLYPPEIGGPATYAKILVDELPKHGFEVELVKFSDVRHLPKFIRHIAYYFRVLRAAKKSDIVFALDPVSVGLPAMKAAQKTGKKFVVKIVGDYAWEQGRQRFGVTEDLDQFLTHSPASFFVQRLKSIQTRVAKAAAVVIVPSTYLRNVIIQWGIKEDTIDVIYNGISVPSDIKLPADRPQGFLIVSIGRRVPWKGFEAIERVVRNHPDWHIKIIHDLPRAEALGWIKSADLFVLNSRYEGLSHALLEAIALGTPVVTTNAGGNGEIIRDGETGRLIPVGDERALENTLEEVAQNPALAQERAAFAKQQDFSLETMIERTGELLKSV
jgi:glycosyltransferase involved in cell wall biosynthesis